MLTRFEVTNFKNFAEKIVLDLTDTKKYGFNADCIRDGVVRKALVYGHNGVGKSNLGFAIFDLVSHTTDKCNGRKYYINYLNASSPKEMAEFSYTFKFDSGVVEYKYGKKSHEKIVYESLYVNGRLFAGIDRRESNIAEVNALGAENLKTDMGASKISVVSYIKANAVLEKNEDNLCFDSFIEFVDGMLFFRSLDSNSYIGFEQGSTSIGVDIVSQGNVEDFENFLNEAGIECKLGVIDEAEEPALAFDFNGKLIPFYAIASQGTKSLALFYYWYHRFRSGSGVSLIFVDEFDAFYHHSLSSLVISKLRDVEAQVITTTHNTSIMTNDLLRPDCYFLIGKSGIRSLSDRTQKELREAHNIEKMYRAGAFDG